MDHTKDLGKYLIVNRDSSYASLFSYDSYKDAAEEAKMNCEIVGDAYQIVKVEGVMESKPVAVETKLPPVPNYNMFWS